MRNFILLIVCLVAGAVAIDGAQLWLNTGTAPNDGTGETLRSGFNKVNTNFSSLFNGKIDSTDGIGSNLRLYGPSGGGLALRIGDGGSFWMTNGSHIFQQGLVLFGYPATGPSNQVIIQFSTNSYISDFLGTKRWNFKTAAQGGTDGNTVATLSDIVSSGSPTNYVFNGNQFSTVNVTNVSIKDGALLSNPVVTGGTMGTGVKDTELAKVMIDGGNADRIAFRGSNGTTNSHLEATDSGPVLYSGLSGSTPLDTRTPDDYAVILNLWTAARLFGALVPLTAINSNRWAIDNWFDGNVVLSANFTNTSWTASRLLGTDSGKRAVSLTTGTGLLFSGITLSVDINGLSADASPDGAADYVMTYDASAGTLKKVLLQNLPSSGGGEANTASSVGSGVSLFKVKSGGDLQFRSVTNASSKMTVRTNVNVNEIEFDVVEAQLSRNNLGGGALTVANGGTGAGSAINARTNLGVAITNVLDALLTSIAEGELLSWNATLKQWTNTFAVSNTAFASSWDGDTSRAPSRNAVFDKVVTLQNGDNALSNLVAAVATTVTNVLGGWGIHAFTSAGTLTINASNAITLMPTNAVTYQGDFSGGTPVVQTADFMRTNVTIYLTNPIVGRVITFCLRGDANAVDRTVTFATNGLTGNWPIQWGFNTPTNGATALSVTNNMGAEISILVKSNAFSAFWSPQR